MAYPPGPERVAALPNYGPNSAPTDRMYIVSAAVGFTAGLASDRYITPNDFLAVITRNVTDQSIAFGGGSVATVSAANQGKLAYDEILQKFKYSNNGAAYRLWLEPAGPTNAVQINNGAFLLDGDAGFTYDIASQTVILGSSTATTALKLRDTTASAGFTFLVNAPSGDNKYTLPDALPTLNQFLKATAVSGVNVTLGWATVAGTAPGTPVNAVQFNSPLGTFAGDAAFIFDNTTKILTLGLASTTTGQITLAVSGSANTTSLQAALVPGASLIYRLPVTSPTANQILSASAPSGGIVTTTWVTAVSPNPPNFSVQINNGAGNFDSNGQFTYDTASNTVIIGSGTALGSLKFRDTTASAGVTFKVSAPSGNNVYTLPDALPTLNQILTATAVSGVNVTLGWSAPTAAATPGTPVNSVQFNQPLGTFAGDSGLLYIVGTTTGNQLDLTTSTITSGNSFSITATGAGATGNTKTALNIAVSGANGTASQTVFGQRISVTNTGTTNTNIALALAASGAATANYALNVTAGNIWHQGVNLFLSSAGATTGNYIVTGNTVNLASNAVNQAAWNTQGLFVRILLLDVANGDVVLRRNAAANLAFGAGDAAAPVAQTLSVQNVVAGTSNTAGVSWVHKGSAGTGTGAAGTIVFQLAGAGTTGTAQNAFASVLTLDAAASNAVGLTIVGNASGAGVSLSASGGGTNEDLILSAKGATAGRAVLSAGNGDFQVQRTDGSTVYAAIGAMSATTLGVILSSSGGYFWQAGSNYTFTVDTGFVRKAAGVIRVSDGGNGIGSLIIATSTDALTGNFTVMASNAATAAIVDVARLGVNSIGTPSGSPTSFGGRLSFSAKSSTANDTQIAGETWFWQNATHVTRSGAIAWSVVNNATVTEYMNLSPAGGGGTFVGTAACLSVYEGTAPSVWTAGAQACKLYLISAASTPAVACIANFSTGATNSPTLMLLRGRGTNASPAVVQSGDELGGLAFSAYANTAVNNISGGALIRAVATETWSNSTTGTDLFFFTSVTGGTIAEKMSLRNTGTLRIGAVSGSFNTTTLLQIGTYASWNTDIIAALYTGANATRGLEIIGTPSQSGDLFTIFNATLSASLFRTDAAGVSHVRLGLNTTSTGFANIGGVIINDTSTNQNGAITATDLTVSAIKANALGTNGDYILIDAHGTFAANANAKTIELLYGATVLFTTGSQIFNSGTWRIQAKVTRTGAATQIAIAVFDGNLTLITANATSTSPTETLSGAVNVKCRGTALSAGDIVQLQQTIQWYPAFG